MRVNPQPKKHSERDKWFKPFGSLVHSLENAVGSGMWCDMFGAFLGLVNEEISPLPLVRR